jgi:hypothetical protein
MQESHISALLTKWRMERLGISATRLEYMSAIKLARTEHRQKTNGENCRTKGKKWLACEDDNLSLGVYCLENMGALTSHKPKGLHGQLPFFLCTV